jgi:iron complex outermembrane receptor protein
MNMIKKLRNGKSLAAISIASLITGNAYAQETGQETAQAEAQGHGHDVDIIFVTASPHGKADFDVLQGSNVLADDDLQENLSATIGETLAGLPGISSTSFGAGASRPIIRGLGGDRIRVLINGIGSIDAASTSPDHAVAGDPLTAERIEIMRGASTLLYGSNAVGGVVNIIDNRIPTFVPENGVSGKARISADSVSNDRSGGGTFNAALTDNLVLHVDGYYRKTDNYSIPGYAESDILRAMEEAEHEDDEELEEEHEEQFGFVENSDLENKGGSVGLAVIGDDFTFGASFNLNDSDYGVPGHAHHDEEEGEEEEEEEHEEEVVRINLDQKRFDLKGNVERDFLFFQEGRIRFGYADYKHIELEGDEVGTTFTNEGWEGRVELIQQEIGNVHGSMGIQLRDREFAAIGEEAFTPPNETFQWGAFVVEEISLDPVTFEIGGRYDHQTTESKTLGLKKSFNTFSFSTGASIHPTENDLIGISASRSERSPTPEELYSNGPHLATSSYEMGNFNLGTEKATSVELTFKRNLDRFTGSVNLYHTWYDDFIYQQETGEEIEELHVLKYQARDAKFYGAEVEMGYVIVEDADYTIEVNASGDFVHARFNGGAVVPRMPATSFNFGLDYKSEYYDLGADVRYVGNKTNTANDILPTDEYVNLDLSATWRPFGSDRDLNIKLQALNVTNEEQRQHTSFLKDLLPMPGRNFRISLNYGF